jgi:mRNA-degrading endonuclease toxin of MazEF toxin-antitoxin module
VVINQGDIFWIDLEEPVGSAPGYSHPHVVVQNNLFNHSRLNTVIVCALSSISNARLHREMCFWRRARQTSPSKVL